jgi:16S rRNA (guanine527-N7)-methyltransferase
MPQVHLPTDEQIEAALRPYGFGPTAEFCEKTRSYMSLLLKWNQRVALTSVTSIREILRVHFGESLFGISVANTMDGRLADVGSGAGFPGTPLAMALSHLEVDLIESNAKKAAFLAELVRMLQLENLQVRHERTESVPAGERFDIVTARAVGEYTQLLDWCEARLNARGRVVLWLGVGQIAKIEKLDGWIWQKPCRVPHTKGRFVLLGSLRGSV